LVAVAKEWRGGLAENPLQRKKRGTGGGNLAVHRAGAAPKTNANGGETARDWQLPLFREDVAGGYTVSFELQQ
jgi:hypothetical protein